SALGEDDVRSRWMRASVETVKRLRAGGVPVVGYTWFPLFTMVDWRYRLRRRPMEQYYIELGLFKLNREGGLNRWNETPLVSQIQSYIQNSEESVGPLKLGAISSV